MPFVLQALGCAAGGVWCLGVQLLEGVAGMPRVPRHVDSAPKPRRGVYWRKDWLGQVVNIFIPVALGDRCGRTVVYNADWRATPIPHGGEGHWYGLDACYPHGAEANEGLTTRFMVVIVYCRTDVAKDRLEPLGFN